MTVMRDLTRLERGFPLMFVLGALLVTGCAGFAGYAPTPADHEVSNDAYEQADRPVPSPESRPRTAAAPMMESAVPARLPDRPDVPPAERLRVYSGNLELSVGRIEAARRAIIDYVVGIGGHVERSQDDMVVVRVPAARFSDAMNRIEREGAVLGRAIETADVTDQYTDLERRLEIAVRSRERLYELLERSEEASERVDILREIRRLTEEVERLRSSLASLADFVAFSRITVRLIPRIPPIGPARDRIPFPWIARLDPLRATVGPADRDLRLQSPGSFAVFESGRRIAAEAADGTRIRAGGRTNDPAGDADFWAEALRLHLQPFYASAEPITVRAFRGVLLESRDTIPHSYLVLVAPRADELIVVEGYFPTAEARDEFLPDIIAMIERGRL